MIVARWTVTAKFGKAREVIGLIKEWNDTFGKQVGMAGGNERLLTGSIGGPESEIQSEVEMESLSDLDAAFAKLGTLDGHAEWARRMEPAIVSGSNRWQVFRKVD